MDHPTAPSGRGDGPPGYNDEPPSYTYPNEFDDDDDHMRAPIPESGRDNTASMRLLPSSNESIVEREVDGYSMEGDLGGTPYRRHQHTTPQRRQYVRSGAEAPSVFISSSSASLSNKGHPNQETQTKDPLGSSSTITPKKTIMSSQHHSPFPEINPKGDSSDTAIPKVSGGERPTLSQTKFTGFPKAKSSSIKPFQLDPPMVPAPLRLATPKPPVHPKLRGPGDSIAQSEIFLPSKKATSSTGLKIIQETKEETEADTIPFRTPVSTSRPSSPQKYYPLHQSRASASAHSFSRPSSSLSNRPNLPPPSAPSVDGSQFSMRPTSPTRPWTPSRGSERPRAPPSASSVTYEPADINGSPRPGTPSSKYGGSPRRPLPPAPLFSGPAPVSEASEASIDIGDDASEEGRDDVFGGNGRVMTPTRGSQSTLRSYDSYLSDSTMVTDEKDGMSKIDLEDDEYNDDDGEAHYGPAPAGRQDRRGVRLAQKSKKEVKLINGELILECKIPTILHSFLPRRDDREFTHMRYTAVTCDPDDFTVNGYKLRQNIGTTMRETELFVCITMYNENEIDFTRTMHGVMRNISHFCSRTKSRTWGKDGWKKIVVCIIADGRHKVHPRTLDALAAIGVYQDGIAKNIVNQKEVTAHVYEYTTQVSLDSDLKFKGAEKGIVPCQMIFCQKERNQKKLNSHRWCFNAFGRALNPNVCILLDVGTKPQHTALYHLWKAFDQDSNVAGAAGEIKASKGKGWVGLLNPLVASQNFEYKMSNILDKPLESVFGYITVLPGALSAYRYHALQNDSTGHGPLSQYFKGEMLHGKNADVFTANMYLAEDRILCWELVAKREEQWLLKFVKNAVGETDVPDTVPEFISQRRRWLNGAFFAAVYSLIHFRQVWKTDHTLARKILLHVEFIYQFVSLIFTFFSLANFYITFFFIAGALGDPKMDPFGHGVGNVIFYILRYALVLLICLQFILSMGNRPQGAKKMFLSSMIVLSVVMMYTTFAAFYMVVVQLTSTDDSNLMGNNVFTNLIVSTLSTVGLFFFMSFLYLDPWHMFTSSAQYFALLPSYICMLQVYAFCNTHDVTWGTKGDNILHTDLGMARTTGLSTVELEMPSEQLDIDSGYDEALRNLRDRLIVEGVPLSEIHMQEDYYRAVRTYMVSIWVVSNAVLAMAVTESYGNNEVGNNNYLAFVLWSVAGLAVFRGLGSTTFAVLTLVQKIAEARMKFINSSSSGGSSRGSSKAASSVGLISTRSTGEKVSDWFSETGWSAKRKVGKLAFWRK